MQRYLMARYISSKTVRGRTSVTSSLRSKMKEWNIVLFFESQKDVVVPLYKF